MFYQIPNKNVSLEYPEDGPQTDLLSVARTKCPVSLSGLHWGTSHEIGPPKLEARVVDVGFNLSSAHWWWLQFSQRSWVSTWSLYRAWTFPRRPSVKIHHRVLHSFTPLTRAVFPRFLITTLPSHWGVVGPLGSLTVPNVSILGRNFVACNLLLRCFFRNQISLSGDCVLNGWSQNLADPVIGDSKNWTNGNNSNSWWSEIKTPLPAEYSSDCQEFEFASFVTFYKVAKLGNENVFFSLVFFLFLL